jgi:hypothetical protein
MPPRYEKWLPKFIGSDEENAIKHMRDFYAFFQLHPISDDVEDLAMKLFSTTLHNNARRWYDGLPDASITSMDQLEEVFLEKWDPGILIDRLDRIKKNKNETVREFHDRFERLLQQIPTNLHPSHNFLLFLYTKAFTGQISFPIRDEAPRTIQEIYHLAIQIEEDISLFKKEQSLVPEIEVGEPKDTPDVPKRVSSLETPVEETLRGLE